MKASGWISLRLGIGLTLLLAGVFVQAQRDNRYVDAPDGKNLLYSFPGEEFSSNVPLNEIRPKAFRSFRRQFPTVQNERWFKLKSGYLIRFCDSDSSTNFAFLDSKGAMVRKIACYSSKNVPSDLKDAVHYVYSPFEIESAVKWTTSERNEYYGILISHENYRKSLEFKNGEFYVVAEYKQASP